MQQPNFEYEEIDQLNVFYVRYQFSWKTDRSQLLAGKSYYPRVNFSLNGTSFWLYIDDEYDDLKKNYPLLVLCLVLRELEGYAYTSDYATWCQERFLNAQDTEVQQAFDQLKKVYYQILQWVNPIDSFVSDWDFEMNAGAAQKLRKSR